MGTHSLHAAPAVCTPAALPTGCPGDPEMETRREAGRETGRPAELGTCAPGPCRVGWPSRSIRGRGPSALPLRRPRHPPPATAGGPNLAVVHPFCARLHFGNAVVAHLRLERKTTSLQLCTGKNLP